MPDQKHLFRTAFGLSIFTIFYNIAEGIIAASFGYEDDALTLFGFGLDSFIETISATGVAYMIYRIRKHPESSRSNFEISALRITGYAFYALCVALSIMAVVKLINHKNPETTSWGIIISLVSIAVMLVIIWWKESLGKKLNSAPLIADANCAKVCVYMSLVLLFSSLLYEWFRIPYIDVAGTSGIVYFSFTEGKECFEKAKGLAGCGCAHDH